MKKKALIILLHLIIVIFYNFIFFTIFRLRWNPNNWIGFIGVHLCYLGLVISLVFKKDTIIVTRLPIVHYCLILFIVNYIVGTVLMFVSWRDYRIGLITELIVITPFLVKIIIVAIANADTYRNVVTRTEGKNFLKELSNILFELSLIVSDSNLKKKILQAHDLIYYSPVQSHNNVSGIEEEVYLRCKNLSQCINNNRIIEAVSTVDSITSLIEIRNNKLKGLN